MPSPVFTPLGALVALLRSCPVTAITWAPQQSSPTTGVVGSPYYDQVPEPAPAFPYVVIEMPESTIEHSDQDYTETFNPTIYVIGLETNIEKISTPYGPSDASVIAWLDSFMLTPDVLSGQGYYCELFIRLDWSLKRDSERDVSGARVWVASAKYEIGIGISQQLRST